jgi:hypothetical protein
MTLDLIIERLLQQTICYRAREDKGSVGLDLERGRGEKTHGAYCMPQTTSLFGAPFGRSPYNWEATLMHMKGITFLDHVLMHDGKDSCFTSSLSQPLFCGLDFHLVKDCYPGQSLWRY